MTTTTDADEHPIIFNDWSINRILAGEKTQTRRIATEDDDCTDIVWREEVPTVGGEKGDKYTGWAKTYEDEVGPPFDMPIDCPYGQPGDVLWVREAFRMPAPADEASPSEYVDPYRDADVWPPVLYPADDDAREADGQWGRKRPSIHMPRELCRIRLRVQDVQVERVQEISDEDVDAGGVENRPDPDGAPWRKWETADGPETNFAHIAFRTLWNDIHGDGAWERNDWVWVVSFSLITDDQ